MASILLVLKVGKQADVTSKRNAKGSSTKYGSKLTWLQKGMQSAHPQSKEASRRDFEMACKLLVLKVRKQVDVTSERHAKGLSSKYGIKQT